MKTVAEGLLHDGSVVNAVDRLLADAIARGASDVHLEPTAQGLRIRYRFDGLLYDQPLLSVEQMAQIISRLKVLAGINIAEKRVPQDGTFVVPQKGQDVDIRVSTFPSLYGEKMVLRILDRDRNQLLLKQLGMSADVLALFEKQLARTSGFFLVTGPTGSGKTTTLYSALSALHAPEKNIITLEDPIEYHVDGITQGQIRPEAGFTFAKGIRALLRQDPDILMVGEIRDAETAKTAIEAALTGHLVLSTLHTNDAPSAVMRLMDMGVESFLINAAVSGVLAQRLARTICTSCRNEREPNDEEKELMNRFGLSMQTVFYGAGCDACGDTGYAGRTGIFELLTITPEMRSLISKSPENDALYQQALLDGMKSLMADGADKVVRGIISLQELARAIG